MAIKEPFLNLIHNFKEGLSLLDNFKSLSVIKELKRMFLVTLPDFYSILEFLFTLF